MAETDKVIDAHGGWTGALVIDQMHGLRPSADNKAYAGRRTSAGPPLTDSRASVKGPLPALRMV